VLPAGDSGLEIVGGGVDQSAQCSEPHPAGKPSD
jgi:hypothetical protein